MKQDSQPRHTALLLGPPGSGKTTLADTVASRSDIFGLDTGRLLKDVAEKDPELRLKLKPFLDEGKLAPAKLVESVIAKALRENHDRHILFVGFPRTQEQIGPFFRLCEREAICLQLVVFLLLSEEEAVERLSNRRKPKLRQRSIIMK